MSHQTLDFGDVVKETQEMHDASEKARLMEQKRAEHEARQEAQRQARERERIRIAYEKEQTAKKAALEKEKKEKAETNERLSLILQLDLYREQYPDHDIPRITEKTPLSKLREVKRQVEAKNAMTFMPPMLHTVSGALVKFYVHMVENMGMNPLDHEVQGLQAFYMSKMARDLMLPAWKATVASNPWLIGGNPWYMQLMMGFYLVAETNSQRVKMMQQGPAEASNPNPSAQSGTMNPGLRTALLAMTKEREAQAAEGSSKGKERM